MIELPEATMMTDDETLVSVKVHRLVWKDHDPRGDREGDEDAEGLISYASLVGPGNAIKCVRLGCHMGMGMLIKGAGQCHFAKPNEAWFHYDFRQTKIGDGYVHCVVRMITKGAVFVLGGEESNDMNEWQAELFRVCGTPLLPEWVPALVDKIKHRAKKRALQSYGCKPQCYLLSDATVEKFLIEAIEAGEIAIPECERDIEQIASLNEYIQLYAEKMVASAGSAMAPLFDPRTETVRIPVLKRKPFVPQAWVIAGMERYFAQKGS